MRRVCGSLFSSLLFTFSILQLLAGIAFIVFSLMLANPPSTGLPLAMIIFGCVVAACAIFGLLSSCCKARSCVTCYIIFGVVLTAVQLAMVLVMIINPEQVIKTINKECVSFNDCKGLTANQSKLHDYVYTGRWVFLGWVCAQAIALMVAIMLCTCCKTRNSKYASFEGDPEVAAARERLRAVQMQNIALEGGKDVQTATENKSAKKLGRFGSSKSSKGAAPPLSAQATDYNSTAANIAAKYGMSKPTEAPAPQTGAWGGAQSNSQFQTSAKGAW